MPSNSNPTNKQTAENDEPPNKRVKTDEVEQTAEFVLPLNKGPPINGTLKPDITVPTPSNHSRVAPQPKNSPTCWICKSGGVTVDELRDHHFSVHMGRSYRCTDCLTIFPTITRLRDHQNLHKQKPGRVLLCSFSRCTMTFRVMQQLDNHFSEKHGMLDLRCRMCGAKFNNSCSYKMHKLTHN